MDNLNFDSSVGGNQKIAHLLADLHDFQLESVESPLTQAAADTASAQFCFECFECFDCGTCADSCC